MTMKDRCLLTDVTGRQFEIYIDYHAVGTLFDGHPRYIKIAMPEGEITIAKAHIVSIKLLQASNVRHTEEFPDSL